MGYLAREFMFGLKGGVANPAQDAILPYAAAVVW